MREGLVGPFGFGFQLKVLEHSVCVFDLVWFIVNSIVIRTGCKTNDFLSIDTIWLCVSVRKSLASEGILSAYTD